jgi:hypothetical protein
LLKFSRINVRFPSPRGSFGAAVLTWPPRSRLVSHANATELRYAVEIYLNQFEHHENLVCITPVLTRQQVCRV